MAETINSLQTTLDHTSQLLPQFSSPNSNNTLQLITNTCSLERGPKYDVYSQLRESNLQSKRLKLDEFQLVSEIPTLDFSTPVKALLLLLLLLLGDFEDVYQVSAVPGSSFLSKSVKFHGNLDEFDEAVEVCEIPKLEYSPILKKSVKFHQNLGTFEEKEHKSAIPKPNFLRKSVNLHGICSNVEENIQISEIPKSKYSPIMKKSMNFQGKTEKKQGRSVLAQSVPDFSSVLRKENRKPTPESNKMNKVPRVGKSMTPTLSKTTKERVYGSASKYNGGGSKSVNSGEKQSNGRMIIGRKSYASIQELKGFSVAAANAITDEIRGGRKSTLFSTKYY